MTRKTSIDRETNETKISLSLNIDGNGFSKINSPLKFLNHMIENFSKHSHFNIEVDATGDVDVDDHHLVEDMGIVLGEAFLECLGDKTGIARMAHSIVPMDDARAEVAIDLSGRPYAMIDLPFSEFEEKSVGDVSKENIEHFLESFAINGKFNVNIKVEGKNDHHKVEVVFKALAKAMREAVQIVSDQIPSTKGSI